ncbi:MAG: DUF2806 domain-containing protein [Solobacterium sp.]|nr:DUF2806 domain-containing protein [Solobacterium sp.]
MEPTKIIEFLNQIPGFSNSVSSIVGAIITAVFLRRNTKTQEFEKIKANKFGEVVNDLLESGKMTLTEYYKTKNFLKIAEMADSMVQEKRNNSIDKQYSFDWFIRYYEASGDISDKEMQVLWAKILAGEIEKPSSYSLRTLDVLRNMSKEEAECFVKICNASVKSGPEKYVIPIDQDYLSKNGIDYSDILMLEEIGLINSSSGIHINDDLESNTEYILYVYGSLIVRAIASEKRKLSLRVFLFTNVANELATLIDRESNEENFLNLCKKLQDRNPGVLITVHRIIPSQNEDIICEDENLLDSMEELD